MKRRNNTAAENAVRAPCTLDQESRELLTRAAQAAGIKLVEWVGDQANVIMPDGNHCGWNPLATWGGGEAMALTVKLRLALIPLEGGGWDVEMFDHDNYGKTLASCANGGAWALQQAIVEAAAKLADLGAPGRVTPGVQGSFNEQEKGLAACPISRGNMLEIKPNDRATEDSNRGTGEEEQRSERAARGDAVRASGAESGARGGDPAQHEVAQDGGTGNGVAPGVAPCETCNGEGTIDERLGGYSFSNPAAKCPDCDGTGEGPSGVQASAEPSERERRIPALPKCKDCPGRASLMCCESKPSDGVDLPDGGQR